MKSGWHRKVDNAATRARVAQYRSPEHRAQRAAGQAQVDAGTASCWRCGLPILPGAKWHVGHDDNDRTLYRGPEHPSCNLKAAARRGNRITNARRKTKRIGSTPSTWQW